MAASAVDPNSNNSHEYTIPIPIIATLALILCLLRFRTRIKTIGKFYLDDWLILVTVTLSVVDVVLACTTATTGWGRPLATLSTSDYTKTMKLQFAVQVIWIFMLLFVRLSVSCSLLRFDRELWWRWTLYILMGAQAVISASWIVIQFGQCRPVSANWEFVADVKCWPNKPIINYAWACAAIYIVMDLVLSLMPIHLIRTLTRSTSEKILLTVLMALGLVATGVVAAKLPGLANFGKGDPMQATVRPSMLASLEVQVGIIVSCLPCFKAPVEQFLKKLGILKEHHLTRPSFVNTLQLTNGPNDQRRNSQEHAMPGRKLGADAESGEVTLASAKSNERLKDGQQQEEQHKGDWDVV